MSETTKVFIPETNGNDVWPMMAAMNNGGFGGGNFNNPFWAIILLAFLRNGFFGGNGWDGNGNNSQLSAIQEQLNTNHGQTLLMDAIKGNASSVKELASMIGCNHNAVQTAINGVQTAIANVGNQVGMGTAQVINAVQSGNCQVAQAIKDCCCQTQQSILKMGYDNQISNLQQTNMIQNGFSQVGYAAAENACSIRQNCTDNTSRVLAKLDAIEDSRKDREITQLTAALTAANARAERQAELAPIVKTLGEIQSKQPSTATVQYPNLVGIPASQLYGLGAYGAYGVGQWS